MIIDKQANRVAWPNFDTAVWPLWKLSNLQIDLKVGMLRVNENRRSTTECFSFFDVLLAWLQCKNNSKLELVKTCLGGGFE